MNHTALVEHADRAAALRVAASHFVRAADGAIAARGRFVAAVSPALADEALADALLAAGAARLDAAAIHVFAASGPGSVAPVASALRLRHRQVHAPRGVEDDPLGAAADYEQSLRAGFRLTAGCVPAFDLALLAVGDCGDAAGLAPGRPATEETGRLAVADCVAGPRAPVVILTLAVIQAALERILLEPVGESPALRRPHAVVLGRSLRLTWPRNRKPESRP